MTVVPLEAKEKAALERLLDHALLHTGQARRVADFLLAWWNAGECGSFDLTNLWAVDDDIASDMAAVFLLIARAHSYPDSLGYGSQFERIVAEWRPELVSPPPRESNQSRQQARGIGMRSPIDNDNLHYRGLSGLSH